MSTVVKPAFRSVGVGAQYICFASGGNDAVNGYEALVNKLKTVAKIDTTEENSSENVYASNEVFDTDVIINPPVLAVENVAFPAAIRAKMRGNEVSGAYIQPSTYDQRPNFAYGVVYPKKNGHIKFVWYPKCQLTEANTSAQTRDGSGPNSQNQTQTIQTYVFNEETGQYCIEYDTELLADGDTAVTEAEFFAQPLTAPISEE